MNLTLLAPILGVVFRGAAVPVVWIIGVILLIWGVVTLIRGALLVGILLIVVGILLGGLNIL
jgi:hypothetical protein